jgi:Fe-Mn family superoxide dismutase
MMKATGGIFNNAAQVWNHTFYFDPFEKDKPKQATGDLLDAINASFGSFDEFKEKFTNSAKTLFRSGWTSLVKKPNGSLDIVQTSNASNPLTEGLIERISRWLCLGVKGKFENLRFS